MNAIKLLVERKVKVLAKTVVMQQNVGEIWKLKDYVENLGAQMRQIGGGLLISPCDNGDKRPLNYRLTDQQLKNYLKAEFKERKIQGQDYKLRPVKENSRLCGSGLATCNITPYGEVNPCVQVRVKNENNLNNKSFIDIWRNNPEFSYLRSLCLKDKKDCQNCRFITYCFSCPGISLLERGSLLDRLPEACRQARLRKEIYGR